jgi:hypothetical protein
MHECVHAPKQTCNLELNCLAIHECVHAPTHPASPTHFFPPVCITYVEQSTLTDPPPTHTRAILTSCLLQWAKVLALSISLSLSLLSLALISLSLSLSLSLSHSHTHTDGYR